MAANLYYREKDQWVFTRGYKSKLTPKDLVQCLLGGINSTHFEKVLDEMTREELIERILNLSDKPLSIEDWDDFTMMSPVRIDVPFNVNRQWCGARIYVEKWQKDRHGSVEEGKWRRKWRRVKLALKD